MYFLVSHRTLCPAATLENTFLFIIDYYFYYCNRNCLYYSLYMSANY